MMTAPKTRTCLWIEDDGLAAARFYTSLFANSSICDEHRFDEMTDERIDGIAVIEFTLDETPFQILQAGPHQAHTDMMSIVGSTDTQAETDRLWDALTTDGGRAMQCGWLKDRWGIAWQITPRRLDALLKSPKKAKRDAVVAAMMPMQKLDIAALVAAHD